MGKIVKYCTACEESFSDKFSFCPNCAAELTAYEMNPVASEPKSVAPPTVFESTQIEPKVEKFEPVVVNKVADAPVEPAAPVFLAPLNVPEKETVEVKKPEPVQPPVEVKTVATTPVENTPAPAIVPKPIPNTAVSKPVQTRPASPVYQTTAAIGANRPANKKLGDDGFYSVTLVDGPQSGLRRMLLLGAFLLVMGTAVFAVVASIYNNNAFVGALDDDLNNIVFVGDDPPAEDPEMPEPKNKDKGGGGGGGGDNDPVPVSKGVLASQSEKPLIPPSAKMDKVTNPELVLKPETQGNRIEQPTNERYGDPKSTNMDIASDGPGSGGGQGTGQGRGQGSGRGTGAGSGDGSGNGGGIGNGNGNGRGNGDNGPGDDAPELKKPVGPTLGINITSKPRANYTDAARQNQVQGTVTLRVTFNANGTIGGISPVSGLPNGLTEQAIAAARNMRFEPAKKNGVPITVTKQVQYSFTLY